MQKQKNNRIVVVFILTIALLISLTISMQSAMRKVASKLEDLHFANRFSKNLIADKNEFNSIRQVPGAMLTYVNPTVLTFNKGYQMYKSEVAQHMRNTTDEVKWDLILFSKEAALECLNLVIPDEVLNNSENEQHKKLVNYLSGTEILDKNITRYYAHTYSGHQFGYFANQLGDGRAISIGQVLSDALLVREQSKRENLWELQLKGAGKTPFSRQGDGRAVLRSSIREFLASELMYHLDIPTTRALSLVKSQDSVVPRDEFYNWNVQLEHAAIVFRLAPSFVRFGSFEHFYYRYKDENRRREEWELIDQLMEYVIRNHYTDLLPTNNNNTIQDRIPRTVRIEFLKEVIRRTARLFAKWQCVGFVHGVLNTDNMSILGLTIDYGPYGFMDHFDPDFVPNHSDSEGRYSYANQPRIGEWNCNKLITALSPAYFNHMVTNMQEQTDHSDKIPYSIDEFEKFRSEMLQLYWKTFNEEYLSTMRRKLGIVENSSDENDNKFISQLMDWMTVSGADMTNFFRRLSNVKGHFSPETDKVTFESLCQTMLRDNEDNRQILKAWLHQYTEQYLKKQNSYSDEDRKRDMDATNPKYILRNWMAHEAIQKAKVGDYSQLSEIYSLLQNPFDEQLSKLSAKYAQNAPQWSRTLKCSCSS